jgi:hypothetical protein
MNLDEARNTLLRSILHTSDRDFDKGALDRSIRGSFNRFMRETGIGRTETNQVTVSNNETIDVTAVPGSEQFSPGLLYEVPFISSSGSNQWEAVRVGSFNTVRSDHEESTATGFPERVAWLSSSRGYLFPTPDAAYTITFPWRQPLVTWDIGTPDGSLIELNLPERYIDDVLWHGSRAYLLRGLPGHPEAESSMEEFKSLIVAAKGEDQPAGVWFANVNESVGKVYSASGYV